MVSFADEVGNGRPVDHISTHKEPFATSQFSGSTPSFQAPKAVGNSCIRKAIGKLNLPPETAALIHDSWRPGTRAQYNSSFRKWEQYCIQGKIDPTNPSLIDVATFLTALYTSGANYNVVATARSTLSGLIQIPVVPSIGSHPIIKRVLKGVYNNRPPKAKCHYIWDTSIVMDYLGLQITEAIGFKALTLKTATLLTILSAQRVSTVHKFKLSGLHFTAKTAIFSIVSDILKHSKPSRKLEPIVFKKFPHNVELCPVRTLTQYTYLI